MTDPSHEKRSSPNDIVEAIHQCILALESDDESTIQELINSCPQWKDELEDFLTNWGGMEQIAEQVKGGDSSVDNQSGNRVGDYDLIEQIGSGGMGVIYKAHQSSLDRMVALKMINRDQTDRERFQVEAEAIAALTHSNIVQVYEIGEFDGRMFFSMQLIEGCNLKEYRKNNQITSKNAARITQTIAQAVHYAHQRGILHRDLKPANVLVDSNGQPHITDFGLAKQLERDNELTVSGAILGTPAYMAPEQAAGQAKNLTTATDVYGLGAILYSLITGLAPFTGESSLEIIRKVVDQPPSSPRIHNTSVDRDLETICLKCLEKVPELRYASAAELANDLQRYLSGQPVNARPVPQLERVWRWCVRNPIVSALTLAVILLLLSTAVTAIFLALSERNARIISERKDRENESLQLDYEQEKLKRQNALQLAEQNKTNLYMSNGQLNLLNGDLPEALLWYSHATERLAPDSEAKVENGERCKSIFNNVAVPIHAIQLKDNYRNIDWGFHDFVELDSRGNRALIQVGEKFFLWECSTNRLVVISELFPNITCAKFCSSADQIVVGCHDNKFAFVNPQDLNVEKQLDVMGPVSGVSISANGKLVGVSYEKSVAFWDADSDQFIEPHLQFNTAVEHVKFDSQAKRAIVVYQDNSRKADKTGRLAATAELLAIEQAGISQVSKIPCRILKRQHFRYPNRRPFWPVFVQQGQSVMLRNEATRIHFYDASDGELIRSFYSQLGDFTYTSSWPGEYYAMGKQGMAAVRRVLHSPPVPDQPSTRKEFMRLIHDGQVVEAIVSPSNLVASCNTDGVVKLWHLHESQFSKPSDEVPGVVDQKHCLCEIPHQGVVRRMAFSDEGSQLITVQDDGLVRIWSLPDYAKQIQEIEVARGGALAKLVTDNEWMIAGSAKHSGHVGNIRSFDFMSGEQVSSSAHPISLDEEQIVDSEIFPGRDLMASIHAGPNIAQGGPMEVEHHGFLQFWSYPDGNPLNEKISLPEDPRSVTFHPAGTQVAVVTRLMQVLIFDSQSHELIATLSPPDEFLSELAESKISTQQEHNGQVAYNYDGKILMAWGCGDKLWVWNLENKTLQFPPVDNSGQKIESAEFSADDQYIAIAMGKSGIVRTYDAETGKKAGTDLKHESAVVSAKFDRQGKNLITSCKDGRARVFDFRTGEQNKLELRHNSRLVELVDACFTPDSKHAITLDNNQNLYVWNLRNGDLVMPPVRTAIGASQILVSANSKRVIIGGGLRRMMVVHLDHLYGANHQDSALKWISTLVSGKKLDDKSTILLSSREWIDEWNSQQENTEILSSGNLSDSE